MNRRKRRVGAFFQMRMKGIEISDIHEMYNLSKIELAQLEKLEKRVILQNGNIKIFNPEYLKMMEEGHV